MINYFNEVLTGLGISKVKLAKYLGVSRQMLYNYLSLESLEDWPEDKKIKIKTLLGIEEGIELSDITISTKYINEVESRLNEDIKTCKDSEIFNKIRSYNREQQELVIDLFTKLKSGLTINKDDKVVNTLEYLRDFVDMLNIYPELKYTSSGKAYASFTLAVQKNKNEAEFIDCTAWEKTAETIAKYFKKGSKILIQGRLSVSNYEQNGEKRKSTKVVVNSFEFVESKNTVNNQSNKNDYDEIEDDEDFPF